AQVSLRCHALLDPLARALLLERAVDPFGQPDDTHAALADRAQQPVRTGYRAAGFGRTIEQAGQRRGRIGIEQRVRAIVGVEQSANFTSERSITTLHTG